jgi:hypothetical protein
VTNEEVIKLFQPLCADIRPEDAFHRKKPLLAHYTTIQTLEKILTNNELWFSNPLFMNDLEEVRFGVNEGNTLVMNSKEIVAACKTMERVQLFQGAFAFYFNKFANEHVLDTYVFCTCNHDKDDSDGLLSMWRGYGANGNGAAIVFDTAQVTPIENSALITDQVTYATTKARRERLNAILLVFARILVDSDIPNENLYLAAYSLFDRIKLFALFSKHHGFKQEQEWRIVYMPERDAAKQLGPMFHYSIGSRGIEPKLKFKVLPIKGLTADDLSLEKIIDRIILGPTVSSPMAIAAVQRMLDVLNQPNLKIKLRGSTIPFRAIG